MMKSAGPLTRMLSIGSISVAVAACTPAPPPAVVATGTLCTLTDRYHTTADQKTVYAARKVMVLKDDGQTVDIGSGEAVFGSLVRWLLGFNKVRDAECLKPPIGQSPVHEVVVAEGRLLTSPSTACEGCEAFPP